MDATDFEELNEEQRERQKQARLLRAASHDIRGPLANVRSYASLLSDPRVELPDRARRAIDVISRNADRALALLREFIDSEQAARGILELPTDAVSLKPIFDKALKAAAPVLEEKGVRLEVEEDEGLVADAEPTALEHILRVLVEHAAERSPPGGVVRVQLRGDGATILARVTDRGPGLSSLEQHQLFDRDAHLARRQKLTTGFRLSLAATEAETMGGGLKVRSGPDETVLELRLPAAAG